MARERVRLIGFALGVKLLVLAVGAVAAEVRLQRLVRTREAFYEVWFRWDALQFVSIARNGYAPPPASTSLAALPLLPWLVRAGHAVGVSYEAAAFGVATLASLAAALLFHALARLDLDEAQATRALVLLLLYPTALFLHVPYSEGLFLALVCGCFLAVRRGRLWTAAGLAALAGLTRLNAFLLAPALALEAFSPRTTGTPAARTAAALGVLPGVAGYLLLNYVVTGDAFAFLSVHAAISARGFDWPWVGAAQAWQAAANSGGRGTVVGLFELGFALLAGVATLVGLRRLRPSYSLWMLANVLLFTAQGFWLSIPRLSLALFPMFLLLARQRGLLAFSLWAAGFALLQGLFVSLFVQGWWVS